jgi:Domain of unknown function (DUF4389)
MSTATAGDNPPPTTAANGSGSRAGSVVLLILGSLMGLLGLAVLTAGTALAAVSASQSEEGFATPRAVFSVGSYAVTSPGIEIAGDAAIPTSLPFDIATFRLQATAADPDEAVFIGIAPRADVERYLESVHHSEVRDIDYRPFSVEYRDVQGTEEPERPDTQDFWIESASGEGPQQVAWRPQVGDWSVVVMNADASEGVDVGVVGRVRTDVLWPVAIGLIVGGGLLFLVGLALLIPGAIGLGRHAASPQAPLVPTSAGGPVAGTDPRSSAGQTYMAAGGAGGAGATVPGAAGDGDTEAVPPDVRRYPAYLVGDIDPGLSRWLWLVKWILAIPHYIILILLWFAFVITTIVAGVAILFTGNYPRSLFQFNVGVLRWNWRVSFYTYSALGTDQYPPFTLARTPYPADFDVDYPERLSNGLVLVKWWLLALPHFLILAVLAGGTWGSSWFWSWSWFMPSTWETWPGRYDPDVWRSGASVLGLLVVVAAVILLFTGRYQRSLFNLIMGINRWVYRVLAYAALMRDEYPPFRLDQGSHEPGAVIPRAAEDPR